MGAESNKDNLILDLSFKFAVSIIEYCTKLDQSRKYELSRQLFKAGTSIGANAMEAQHAESKNDFIHKIKISSKEAGEAKYWLLLCQSCQAVPPPEKLLFQIEEIIRVLGAIISTTKRKYVVPTVYKL